MFRYFLALGIATVSLSSLVAAPATPLFQWNLAEGMGKIAHDSSGNNLHGTVTAKWKKGEHGTVLEMNGTGATQVTIDLPKDKRFGTGSWTLSAWVNPARMGMPESREKQNVRRMFSYGKWPQAIITLNLGGNGNFGCFMAYTDVEGKRVDGGAASASNALQRGEWAHVVMVCDRENRQLRPYVNSIRQGASGLSERFNGNFDVYGNLSFGNGWQNFWGDMGPITVYRQALTGSEIIALYREQGKQFGIKGDEELDAREKKMLEAIAREEARQDAVAAFSKKNEIATAALQAKDFPTAIQALADIVGDNVSPAHYRSYAHLRLAQVLATSGDGDGAKAEYAKIAAQKEYPAVHRNEAAELVREMDRSARGLPPRDPKANRTNIPNITQFAREFFVSPTGNDANDGSREHPFKTLTRARDAVRNIKAEEKTGAICVHIASGEYQVTETLELTAADSGSPNAPIIYRADKMGEAVLYGGKRVSGFTPVNDPAILKLLPEEARGKVWQADLRAQGITDYATLRVRGGIGQPTAPPTLEVFVDQQPMTLARWPNKGFVGIRELIEPGSAKEKKPSVFGYIDDRHARWTQAKEPWLLGYWNFLWADATIQVAKIDTEAKTITTVKPYNYGNRGMNNHQGIIYYAFNLLEEIDQPGEWYLDRQAGILYLYPPKDLQKSTVEIGMFPGPMVTFDEVSNVHLEGLVFDLARDNGILAKDSSDCLLAGCTIKRMAATGIIVNGGERFKVFGCDLHTLGRRGVEIRGGDRKTLQPAGHVVENCRIHFFGRVDRTYTHAVTLGGVGNKVSHNLLYNCPTSVISIGGNDHLFQFNDIHSAVQESDDQGGIDMWGNPTFRGNIFRYNRFRDLGKTGSEHSAHGQAAIRFDDAISGQLVYGNILYNGSNGNFGAVQMNSGRDNIFDNNLFINNRHAISGGWSPGNNHWKHTKAGKKAGAYVNDLYLQRYPEIARMFDDKGQNFFWRNVFWQFGTLVRRPRNIEMLENAVFEDNEDPGFIDIDSGDFRLRPDSPVFERIAFRQIPVAEIGLYPHPLRASWPVKTTPVKKADWKIGFKKQKKSSGIMPHTLALNPIKIPKVKTAPVLDGQLADGEWPGKAFPLNETPNRKPVAGKTPEAWFVHNGNSLYVAVRIPMKGKTDHLAKVSGDWGQIDGVEICLREIGNTVAGKQAPTLILQGFPSGKLLGATNPNEFSMREALALARLSRFTAKVVDGEWIGEWEIPIPGIGLAYTPGARLQFNIGAHRSSPNDWTALAGALGANYQLNNAAVIILE